jgi:nicotinate-nucleotide--dimethylbenzimidazole phosphoribosyltransferase
MLCQACENNETTQSVICDSCVSHYASIREGQYQEQELVAGEAHYVVRSWVHIEAPQHKKAARDDKAGKKKGFFGKKEAPEAAPEPDEAPPPDWKNRVFPLPDPVAPAPAAAAAAAAEVYTAPTETEFSYGSEAIAAPAEALAAAPEEAQVLDLGGASAVEAPADELNGPTPADPNGPAKPDASVFELSLETPEPEVAAPTHISEIIAQAITADPVVPAAPEPIEPPAPALGSFFESLSQPAPAAEPEVASTESAPAPAAELANFFESLGQPAAPAPEPTAAEPVAEAAPVSPDLSSFFASLSATPAAPVAAPAVTPEPEPEIAAPSADLASFFDSLNAPAAPPEAAPEEATTEVVITSCDSVIASRDFVNTSGDAVSTNVEPPAVPEAPASGATADLSTFFDTLSQPAAPEASFDATPEPQPPAAQEASQATPWAAPAAPEPIELPTASSPDLSSFFESLSAPAAEFHVPAAFEVPAPAEPATGARPFSIELDLPTASGTPGMAKPPVDLKPPTIGTPFTIDLTPPPAPAPQARQTSESLELKRKLSSTGELSFADDEDDDAPADGGLLSGLSYSGGASPSGGFEIVRDDDEDDERTIEL